MLIWLEKIETPESAWKAAYAVTILVLSFVSFVLEWSLWIMNSERRRIRWYFYVCSFLTSILIIAYAVILAVIMIYFTYNADYRSYDEDQWFLQIFPFCLCLADIRFAFFFMLAICQGAKEEFFTPFSMDYFAEVVLHPAKLEAVDYV